MKLSIIVPCYNEEKNIPLILDRFAEFIKGNDLEVILVNNGSTDNSQNVLDQLLPSYSFARQVIVPVNQGYGFGILEGLKVACGEYIGWTHADMQTDPKDVLRALEIITKHDDERKIFIKGDRRGRSLWDNFFTVGMSVFETIYLRCFLYEINAQPTIFPRSFFTNWSNPPFDFSLDLYALYLAKKSGYKVYRLPVQFPQRKHGTSSWNTGLSAKWKFIKRTLLFSYSLKQRGIK